MAIGIRVGAILRKIIIITVLLFVSLPAYAQSDDHIKQLIIEQSIRNYSGNCPCPYSRDRAGRKCGKRSAYSKPGGANPICYPSQVTQDMIEDYRASH